MAAPFAVMESRINSAVMSRLSNATATINGTSGVAVVFDDQYFSQMNMIDGGKPAITVLDADIPVGTRRGAAVVVLKGTWSAAKNFTVADKQPDGTGMTVLILEKA